MIFQLLLQTIVAIGLLQMYPHDAGAVERRATLPQAAPRAGVYEALSLLNHALPQAAASGRGPTKVDKTSIGVVTSAVSAIVMDRQTGEILYEKNADTPRSIGSISKLMAVLVFLQGKPNLDASASIQPEDVRFGGEQHVAVGDQVTVRDLLKAALIGSDNTSVYALMRLSGMSEGDFVSRMNETAADMGLENTTFEDPSGLSPENRSIAPDLARLVDEAVKNPIIRSLTEMPSADIVGTSGRVYKVETTDDLLGSFLNKPPYQIVGGKTGYLPEAGYCFGSVFSKNGKDEIVVVVLGSHSMQGRFQDAKALAAWAYKAYAWPGENI